MIRRYPYDLAISNPTYFDPYRHVPEGYRRGLWLRCLEALGRVDWWGMEVVLVTHDDGSTSPPTKSELAKANLPSELVLSPHDHHFGGNFWRCAAHASTLGYWTLQMDDDGLLAPNWVARWLRLLHQHPTSIAYGLFNTPKHQTVEEHLLRGYVLKRSLPELGLLFRSDDLVVRQGALLQNLRGGDHQDLWPCLTPSAMQHIGTIGFNNEAGDDFDPEVPL